MIFIYKPPSVFVYAYKMIVIYAPYMSLCTYILLGLISLYMFLCTDIYKLFKTKFKDVLFDTFYKSSYLKKNLHLSSLKMLIVRSIGKLFEVSHIFVVFKAGWPGFTPKRLESYSFSIIGSI